MEYRQKNSQISFLFSYKNILEFHFNTSDYLFGKYGKDSHTGFKKKVKKRKKKTDKKLYQEYFSP